MSQILTPPPDSSSSGTSANLIVGVAIGGVVVVAVFALLWLLFARKKRRRDPNGTEGCYLPRDDLDGIQGAQHLQQNCPTPAEQYQVPVPPPLMAALPAAPPWPPRSPSPQSLPPPATFMSSGGGSESSYGSFSYDELAMATTGFAESNMLGQGGFGYVHKGVLPNGKEIAVKSLNAGSGQREQEFHAEVDIISRLHHKHLVTMVGYCSTGSHRFLVYEFVPNQTLEFHLHAKQQPVMDWPIRLMIALGAAKGLSFLHEDCHPKIIHRDIKAANILIDNKFEAKLQVTDFGLSKFSSDVNTHISTPVMVTFGYLALECASSEKLTCNSNVFSYGIMLLELITGRRAVDSANTCMDDSLVKWARPLLTRALEDNNFESLVDSRLENNFDSNQMAHMVACAAACVRHSARRRPRMSQVVRALEQ